MAWRNIHISNPSKINIEHQQLCIHQQDETVKIPLEDIACIIMDTSQITLTGAVLVQCAAYNIALVQSDETHHPAMIGLAFGGHYRHAAILETQMDISLPLKKQLWQKVIQQKIKNQQSVLQYYHPDKTSLSILISRVKSGDHDNIEARAARIYWSGLWPDFFRNKEEDIRNAMLNYGYAIVRAAISRVIVGAGLLPALGIHHGSMSNGFNLSDDMIEPFRPMVDEVVFDLYNCDKSIKTLTLDHRRILMNILYKNVKILDEKMEIMHAIERTIFSLVRAYQQKDSKLLQLVQWIK